MVMGANVLAIAPGSSSGFTTALCLGALGRAHKIQNSVVVLTLAPSAISMTRQCRDLSPDLDVYEVRCVLLNVNVCQCYRHPSIASIAIYRKRLALAAGPTICRMI